MTLYYFITPLVTMLFGFLRKKVILRINENIVTDYVFVFLIFLIPFYVFAFRNITVGRDTAAYCIDYAKIGKIDLKSLVFLGYYDSEKGFLLFCKFLTMISTNPRFFLFATSILINFLYARVIINQGEMILEASLIYFSLGGYLYNLNIMRQAIAVGIVLNAIPLIVEKKYIKYITMICIASSFHIFSITCMLLVLPIRFVKNKNQLRIILILLSITVLFSLQLVYVIVQKFFFHFDYYFRNDFHADQRLGLTSLCYIIIEMFTVFIMLKSNDNDIYGECGNKLIVYSVALILSTFSLIMMPVFGVYERIARFFQPFLILAIPFSLRGIKRKNNRFAIKTLLLLYSFVYYYYIIYFNIYEI